MALVLLIGGSLGTAQNVLRGEEKSTLHVIVMDPLSSQLSCPCVEGYAQRDYEALAQHLRAALGREVQVTFAETLAKALEQTQQRADLIIGKDSVIRADAAGLQLKVTPIAALTDKQGATTQHGLIVVRHDDAAQAVSDLKGYQIRFGPAECAEKHAAAFSLLKKSGIPQPKGEPVTDPSCSTGACKVIELGTEHQVAAVISSYATPLLEGCGTIKRGELRIVGKTEPVPFITAFVPTSAADESPVIQQALLSVAVSPGTVQKLESLLGFLEVKPEVDDVKKKELNETTPPEKVSTQRILAGWMGPDRNGRVARLPQTLPDSPEVLWKRTLLLAGLGGIAATDRHLLFGDRDTANFCDVWRCLDARTGVTLWEVHEPALGNLDYGNSPRSTPLIVQEFEGPLPLPFTARAFVLGAFGQLLCLDLETGIVIWRMNLADKFQAKGERPWGYCGSPLMVDGKLIVAPGANEAAVVALNPLTGAVIWKGPGRGLGHGSLIAATLGGKLQIVGHDGHSLRAWDVNTGDILWTLTPEVGGDFNVPTPIVYEGQLCVATENNGTRLYQFDDAGRIQSPPIARYAKLHPDMSTPQPVGDFLLAVHQFLYCLNLRDGLQELWRIRDPALGDYAAAFTDDQRMLVIGKGELLLISPREGKGIQSRCRIFEDSVEVYSHAALVDDRLYVRGEKALKCLKLK